jgi:hypothetical protein
MSKIYRVKVGSDHYEGYARPCNDCEDITLSTELSDFLRACRGNYFGWFMGMDEEQDEDDENAIPYSHENGWIAFWDQQDAALCKLVFA